MEPGSPRSGPIFTYTPWPSMAAAFLAAVGINAALFARERTGRGQHVETSLLQAAFSLTASKWQRAEHNDPPGYRTWIYDRRAPKGFFRCSDDRWVEQWVPNPRFVLSSADGDTLALRRDVDRVRDDPDRVAPDPENIIVLAHYYPEMAEAFARFPSDEWVRVAARRRRPAPTGAHARGGARATRRSKPTARSSTYRTPSTARSARSASSTASARLRDGSRGPCPTSVPTRTSLRSTSAVRDASSSMRPRPHRRPTSARRDHGARPRIRGRGSVRHPGPRRPRRQRHQGERHAVTRGGTPTTSPTAPTAASAASASTSRTPTGSPCCTDSSRRPTSCTPTCAATPSRRLHCDEESLRAVNPDIIYCHTRGFDRGPRSRLARQRPDRLLPRRCHLRGRWLPRRRATVLEPHLTRRHRQRVPLRHRRDPGAVPPRPHRRQPRASTPRS